MVEYGFLSACLRWSLFIGAIRKGRQTMRSDNPRSFSLRVWLFTLFLLCLTHGAMAHERFVAHTPKEPLSEDFFQSLNPNMLSVAGRVAGIMALMLFIWFVRSPLDNFIENKVLRNLKGKPKYWLHLIACFMTDKPVEHPWFTGISKWVVILFLRCPALVLMFAAANNSLVMPSFPLEPSTQFLFQMVQVIMAMGILTQTFLPLGGATIFGTFIFLIFAYDWKATVDVLPVLTVAAVYVSSPWDSWKRPITSISREQMRYVRFLLGVGFFILGWIKIYNYYLTIGVADQFPAIMQDPMIKIFSFGTDPCYYRECWIMAFSMAEVLTGFLLMMGVFSRVWCLIMVYLFSKLMIVDFGWNEIPHLYPIGAFLVVCFSNTLSDEFYRIESREEKYEREGKTFLEIVSSLIAAILIAALVVFPALWFLTRVPHPPYFPKDQVNDEIRTIQQNRANGTCDQYVRSKQLKSAQDAQRIGQQGNGGMAM